MGTRSKIFLREKMHANKLITYCILYIPFDGYLDCVGIDLIKCLITIIDENAGEKKIVPGCFFAKIVAYMVKETRHEVLIEEPDCDKEEEWNYYVDVDYYGTEPIKLTIKGELNFSGSVQEAYQRFVINKEHEQFEEE